MDWSIAPFLFCMISKKKQNVDGSELPNVPSPLSKGIFFPTF